MGQGHSYPLNKTNEMILGKLINNIACDRFQLRSKSGSIYFVRKQFELIFKLGSYIPNIQTQRKS